MIIDETYFRGEINIPQLSQPAVLEKLELFITKYETKFLVQAFGLELFSLILVYLATPDGDPIEERIRDIVEGVEFSYDEELQIWGGLRNTEKQSPVANFIFYHYVLDAITFLSQVGEAGSVAENSQKVSSDDRLVFVNNEMVQMMESLKKLMRSGDYPEYKPKVNFEIINRFNL